MALPLAADKERVLGIDAADRVSFDWLFQSARAPFANGRGIYAETRPAPRVPGCWQLVEPHGAALLLGTELEPEDLPNSMMELTISVTQAQYYIERNSEVYAAGWLTNRRRGSGAERNARAGIKLGPSGELRSPFNVC